MEGGVWYETSSFSLLVTYSTLQEVTYGKSVATFPLLLKIKSFMGSQRRRITFSKVARPTHRHILYLYSSDIPYNPQGKILVGVQFQVLS